MRTLLLSLALLFACSPGLDAETQAALARHQAERPGDPAVLYVAARAYDRAGDTKTALATLRKLATSGFDDALEPGDFPKTLGREDGRALAQHFAHRAKVVVRSDVAVRFEGGGLMPEGHAYDAKRGRFLISSGRLRKVVSVDRGGTVRDVTQPGQDGLLAVLGMKVDAGRDVVWALSAAAPFMADAKPGEDGKSMLHAFDLETGATRAVIASPRSPSLLNDLDLAADGSVYASDSRAGTVVVARGGEFADVLPPGSFEGPNGVALAPAGDALFVADFRGIHRVDLATRTAALLPAPAPAQTLAGIDGLYLHEGALIGVQNVLGRGRVWRLRLRADGRALASAEILETGRPDYANPTTGTIAGGDFYYLANPGAKGDAPLVLLRMPLG